MKKILTVKFLFAILVLLSTITAVFAQRTQPQLVYDPANDGASDSPAAETELVRNAVLPAAKNAYEIGDCDENLKVIGRAEGAFTRRGAKQTAYLFEYCSIGNGMANNGILITENQKTAALYTFDGGWAYGFSRLPDMDSNGLDEMAIHWAGGMHQGQISSATVVVQATPTKLYEIAAMQNSWSVCDGETKTLKCGYAYKITVWRAIAPVFQRTKMIGEGKKWRAVGTAQKAVFFKTNVKYQKII